MMAELRIKIYKRRKIWFLFFNPNSLCERSNIIVKEIHISAVIFDKYLISTLMNIIFYVPMHILSNKIQFSMYLKYRTFLVKQF